MYRHFFKRVLDIVCALLALTVFSPLFLALMIVGAIKMKGNPFFTQERPGYKEKIFKLIKFRTMTNEKDENGNLLPDEVRLNKYGKFLRSTSLDELPEAINILIGDMSVIGPRPWLVRYLPYFTERERHRHDVKPGLSGWAQVHGRNLATWEERLELDLYYVEHVSLGLDIRTIFDSVKAMITREDITLNAIEDFDEYRKHSNTEAKTN
jgi:lipopolysaccharide/colanic/teichoic acid biosynthesis glycosyltransferase